MKLTTPRPQRTTGSPHVYIVPVVRELPSLPRPELGTSDTW
jgi:hypothetical protein